MCLEHGTELLEKAGAKIRLVFFSLLAQTVGLLRSCTGLVGFYRQLLLLGEGCLTGRFGFALGLFGLSFGLLCLLCCQLGLLAHALGFAAFGLCSRPIFFGLLAALGLGHSLGAGLGFSFRGFASQTIFFLFLEGHHAGVFCGLGGVAGIGCHGRFRFVAIGVFRIG